MATPWRKSELTSTYNAVGQFGTIARYNDTAGGSGDEIATSTYSSDSAGKLTGLAHKQGGTNLFTPYSWTFDNASRITQFVSADGTSDYTYDKTSQLTAADHNYQSDESYSYDANGNRDSTGYTTGSDNRMTADGTYTYTYDDEGNRTSRTHNTTDYETLYEWDYRNRLTKVTERNDSASVLKVVQYTYDLFDRRIGKAVDTTSPFNLADAAIERYVYDDLNGVSSVDGGNVVLDFVDPDGNGSTAIALSARQLYASRVDQILAKEDVTIATSSADRVQWPLVDHLGTVRDLVENDGTLGEHYEYDSYGHVISGDTSVIRYLYTSREHDPDTGLQYNRARWYDAAVGRWISQDPIGFEAGDANLARYVGNRTTDGTDASGLWTWREYVDAYRRAYADHVNPWDGTDSVPVDGIDHFLHYGTMAGQGTAAAAGGVYVYTAVTGATVTVGAAASALSTEVADTLAEEALSAATGHDVIIPVSFVDVAQDLGRLAARKGAQNALRDSVLRPDVPTTPGIPGEDVIYPDPKSGYGYGVNDPPVRTMGPWSEDDLKRAIHGHPPRGLGSPDVHHADQMPGSAIHEVIPTEHRYNPALHKNPRNQGVTDEMRKQDRELHWWYRAREQGADNVFPEDIYD